MVVVAAAMDASASPPGATGAMWLLWQMLSVWLGRCDASLGAMMD